MIIDSYTLLTYIDQLIRHEGIRLKPYKCTSGRLTIGVGRNLDDKGITKSEALHLLRNDVDECVAQVSKELPWSLDLDTKRFGVLVNMCFNLGMKGLLKFERFLRALQDKNYEEARKEMLDSSWAKQVKGRAIELADIISKEMGK